MMTVLWARLLLSIHRKRRVFTFVTIFRWEAVLLTRASSTSKLAVEDAEKLTVPLGIYSSNGESREEVC
jgi:hypothetical protein